MNEQHATFPSALEAFFLVLCLWAVDYLVSCALFDAHRWLGLGNPFSLLTLSRLLANGVLFTVLLHWKNLAYRDLFNSSRSAAAATMVVIVPLVLLATPCLFLLMGFVNDLLLAEFPLRAGMENHLGNWMAAGLPQIMLICIIAPVVEEMLFRGIILRSFLQQYERSYAILGSAVVFGFYHMNIYQLVGASLFGIFAGWLYERTRSLIPGIAMHAAVNTTVMLMAANAGAGASGSAPAIVWLLLLPGLPACYMLRRVLSGAAR
ncbi:CPBP family intramembrane glutamic endopeptidase [Pseudoduganella sp. HUAS MS19]